MVTLYDDNYIAHYGTPRHSGRYPWGSGHDEEASQRNKTLLDSANDMRKKGLTDVDIAKGLGITTTKLRDLRTIARAEAVQEQIHIAQKLKEKGLSNGAIADKLREAGYKVAGESQVRALLQPIRERKAKVLDVVTTTLRDAVDRKGYVDVGSSVEFQLNTTSTVLRSALQRLKDEGYNVYNDVKVEQLNNPGNYTHMKVLTKPETSWGDTVRNRGQIQQVEGYSNDGGLTVLGIHPPLSISSSRVGVRYAKDGGDQADGVIYVRPGVPDVYMGGKRYAQVRVAVDGTHYLKGMAIYKDDLPDGVDLLFNTSKHDTGNKLDAMKELKKIDGNIDTDNPFGATIAKQIGEGYDPKTNRPTTLTSVMNLVNEEGKWSEWSKNLPSQMLSKQKPALAKEQLDLAYQQKKTEYDTIMSLTNPSVKKKLLQSFTDGVDSAAVHLKAAHLPRQKTQVILPIASLKEDEVYAPNFKPGERVALIRFPHGGTFEIPQLTVNNKNPEAIKLLGPGALDAIGIHSKVAERLSGADFDGDTVLVIPNDHGKVRSSPALEGLKNFNAKEMYPHYEGMKVMSAYEKGIEMGKVSNLITDMTIGHATNDELARAVRHSMVVIDAEKHKLDYRRSERANGIAALKKKYQTANDGVGAATLISRAKSRADVRDRKLRSARDGGPIDPVTGKKVYTYSDKSWTDSKGKTHYKEIQSTKLAETDDAHTLSSGSVVEKHYADYSNRLKALANQGRRELVKLTPNKYSPSAKKAYPDDVKTLEAKLRIALQNTPLERQAQVVANHTVAMKKQDNPELTLRENTAELKRIKAQALAAARIRTGADKVKFEITDSEWAAIQAGAFTPHKVEQFLTYADLKRIKELAMPRQPNKLTSTQLSRAKTMHARGYTWAEIADTLGVSVSTAQRDVTGTEGD